MNNNKNKNKNFCNTDFVSPINAKIKKINEYSILTFPSTFREIPSYFFQ